MIELFNTWASLAPHECKRSNWLGLHRDSWPFFDLVKGGFRVEFYPNGHSLTSNRHEHNALRALKICLKNRKLDFEVLYSAETDLYYAGVSSKLHVIHKNEFVALLMAYIEYLKQV